MINTPITTQIENLLVVKIGGGAGLDMNTCLDDLAVLAETRPVVVVHGVSATMDALCTARGLTVRTLTSPSGHTSRYTDSATRDAFVEVATEVNSKLVIGLRARGAYAVGLTDQAIAIQGNRKTAIRAVIDGHVRIVRDDFSGSITNVNAAPLWSVLAEGATPVIPPLATSDDGLLNIDGDRAAAAIAGSLSAHELVILSNVRGLYRNFEEEDTFIGHIPFAGMDHALQWAQGRMKRKVIGAREALESGVRRVVIADGRSTTPLLRALNGHGTEFVR